jgi:Icc protein
MRELVFFHLSDLHLTAGPEELLFGQVDPAVNLRAVAAELRRMDLAPAFIVISGDLAHQGSPATYHALRELLAETLAPFGVPVVLALGNHDDRRAFRQVFFGEDDGERPYAYSQWVEELRIIVLDSLVPGEAGGWLGEEQLDWLERELATPAPRGNLLVVHHPVVHRGVSRLGEEELILRDRAALAERVRGRPILGILSGHTHVATAAPFAGTTAFTATATAFLGDPSTRDGGRMVTGAGFNLGTVRDGMLIVNSVVLPSEQRLVAEYRFSTRTVTVAGRAE